MPAKEREANRFDGVNRLHPRPGVEVGKQLQQRWESKSWTDFHRRTHAFTAVKPKMLTQNANRFFRKSSHFPHSVPPLPTSAGRFFTFVTAFSRSWLLIHASGLTSCLYFIYNIIYILQAELTPPLPHLSALGIGETKWVSRLTLHKERTALQKTVPSVKNMTVNHWRSGSNPETLTTPGQWTKPLSFLSVRSPLPSVKSSSAEYGYFAFGAVCHKFESCRAHHGPVAQMVVQRQQCRPAFLCFLYHDRHLRQRSRSTRRQCLCRLLQSRTVNSFHWNLPPTQLFFACHSKIHTAVNRAVTSFQNENMGSSPIAQLTLRFT